MRNEIKISFEEPKYHIDQVNKVVVCILTAKPLLPNDINYTAYQFIGGWVDEKFTTKGIARLNPEDEFDINIGMKVSLAKAENKAYETVGVMLKDYLKGLNKAYEQCKDFLWKSANVIEHNDEYLKQF